MQQVTLKDLLKAGLHFGHQTQRWHPKMKPYLFGVRNGIHIIDLEKTAAMLQEAYDFAYDMARKGGTILFVGTKKQAQKPMSAAAAACGMPFVVERWLGGTITNFKTISQQIKKLNQYEAAQASGDLGKYTKKERLVREREFIKLKKVFDGMRNMTEIPNAVFVVDVKHEHLAIHEAKNRGLKVIAIVDSNSDPRDIDYVIPANDDAAKGVALIAAVIAEAINRAKSMRSADGVAAVTPQVAPTQSAQA